MFANKTRENLFTRLQRCMFVIGKEMHAERAGLRASCSPAQKMVLLAAAKHQPINIKELANLLRITSGAATQHVEVLEAAGLLGRSPSKDDRRKVVLQLTRKGKNAVSTFHREQLRIFNEMFNDINDSELGTLVELMEKVSRKYMPA